jgi:hypothetical protein
LKLYSDPPLWKEVHLLLSPVLQDGGYQGLFGNVEAKVDLGWNWILWDVGLCSWTSFFNFLINFLDVYGFF